MNQLKKYNRIVLLLLMLLPTMVMAEKSDNEKTKSIVEEFDVNDNSKVYFKHRRGVLKVKYIQGSRGKVEATVTVKGDDLEDIQTLLDAMKVDVTRENGQIEIKTINNIISWSSNSGLWGSRHKIVLSNGKIINSKIDDVTIDATLYLPMVNELSLSNRYDNIIIDDYKADKLGIDIHSATIKAGDLMSDTYIKVKYGTLDIQNIEDLNLDSHDSKGVVGDIRQLLLKDKYSKLKFGNLQSLDADIHDADIEFGAMRWNANIKDKYSNIKVGDFEKGKWDLHDSEIEFNTAVSIDVRTKYSTIKGKFVENLGMNSHDDDFKVELVSILDMRKSKYTKVSIMKLGKMLILSDSHDDTVDVDSAGEQFRGITFNAKYTNLNLPLPAGVGYAIDAIMKYGQLNYPEKGLKEIRYIKDGSDLEVRGVAADGSKGVTISIQGHDCNVDLEG